MINKAVFLDRDGVLNKDKVDYVYTVEEFKIFDGVADALSLLKNAGFKLIIITNQSGIAKGVYDEKAVYTCFEYLQSQTGHLIDDMYFCPHHPDYDIRCECRKPGSAMIFEAIIKYEIDAAKSFMVGDAQRDITAGNNAGLRSIHVNNGKEAAVGAIHSVSDLLEAARYILDNSK